MEPHAWSRTTTGAAGAAGTVESGDVSGVGEVRHCWHYHVSVVGPSDP